MTLRAAYERGQKLRVSRGDTIDVAVGPVEVDGVAQDITGSTITFTAKDRIDDLDGAAAIRSLAGHVTILPQNDPATKGRARIAVPGALTDGFTTDRVLYWDVEIRAGAVTKTLGRGLLYVERDVTRAP